MLEQLPSPRIVVAATNSRGRSEIASDAPVSAWRSVPERPGYRVSDIWALFEAPAKISDPNRASEHRGLVPPKNGNVLRILDYPPEPVDPVARKKMFEALFSKLFPDGHDRPADARHPGLHSTDTVDYAFVMAGEIYAVMDDSEVLLRAGDILIQCGNVHAWSNRSTGFARLAVVLIDAKRD
jgi:mannose-6-phosphate isomerase-like protein (cupin superfamily)